MKKIIITIIIILAIISLGLGIYFAWQKTQQILTPPTIGQQPSLDEQTALLSKARLGIISDQPIFDYWVSNSTSSGETNEIFYLNQTGQVLKIKDGADEIVSSESINNIQSIENRNNSQVVLIKFGDIASPQFKIFNTETKIWQPLLDVSAAALSPDSQNIAYLQNNGDLIIRDLFGAKPKTAKIISINQEDLGLYWLNSEKILLVPKPSYQYQSQIWAVDIKKKTIDVLSSGQGLIIKWSSDGQLGLRFQVDQGRWPPQLNLIDNKGFVKANLNFPTLPDKCYISQPMIYCAIPLMHNLIKEPLLPDDYFKRAVYFKDAIYAIDMEENLFELLFTESEPVLDVSRLSFTDNKLIFVNRYDNKLYSLEL